MHETYPWGTPTPSMQEDDNVTKLVVNKTDQQKADEIRERTIKDLTTLCLTMDEAKKQGFAVSFGLGLDFQNRTVIANLTIAKTF